MARKMGGHTVLYWQPNATPSEIEPLLRNLGEEYPVRAGRPKRKGQGLALRFERIDEPGVLRVKHGAGEILIQYAGPALAARALGCIWAGAVHPGCVYEEKTPFKSLGFMPDCSRNSVITVVHFKKWLCRCALLGYNQAMLYTEDVYELPDEPFFGYMRGAYTAAELMEIDRYAADMGIEMVACIQTLGHLGNVLRWPAYANVRDGADTLLTLVPETYKLIDKILAHWARVFKSRRILVGMDESVNIGQGSGSYRIGNPRPPAELFFNHLEKVAALSKKHGLQPMIWSDLVFWVDTPQRSLDQAYYGVKVNVRAAAKIRARLPDNIELVYWDYTGDVDDHENPAPYIKRIKNHRAVGREPIMASGCWAWGKFWHDAPNLTEPRVTACVKACRQAGVKELLMTLWTGIDGVDLDSAWAGLAFSAEHAFFAQPSKSLMERRYRAIFGADYLASRSGALDIFWAGARGVGAPAIFWDDPLEGMLLRSFSPRRLRRIESQYRKQAKLLARWRGEDVAGDMDYVRELAEFLGRKTGLSHRLQSAYRRKSRGDLRVVRREISGALNSLDAVRKSFRRMWLRQYKPFGMKHVQERMAGLAARFEELDQRLDEYLKGKISGIAELDVPPVEM